MSPLNMTDAEIFETIHEDFESSDTYTRYFEAKTEPENDSTENEDQ